MGLFPLVGKSFKLIEVHTMNIFHAIIYVLRAMFSLILKAKELFFSIKKQSFLAISRKSKVIINTMTDECIDELESVAQGVQLFISNNEKVPVYAYAEKINKDSNGVSILLSTKIPGTENYYCSIVYGENNFYFSLPVTKTKCPAKEQKEWVNFVRLLSENKKAIQK